MTTNQSPGQAHGHDHGEAFCHMTYASDDRTVVRRIWNSRDGVTPFGCTDPEFGVPLKHVNWREDRYDRFHVPELGEWIWVDLHPERAMQLAMERVEQFWHDPKYPLSEQYDRMEDAARMFLDAFLYFRHPDTGEKVEKREPDLVQVTEPLRDDLIRLARENRPGPRPIADRPMA